MPRPTKYSDERGGRGATHDRDTRAAVLAALLSGSTPDDIERAMKVPESTVRRWRDQAGIGPAPPPERHTIDTQKSADLGELVGDYLNDILVTLRAQAVHTRDPEWLVRQGAGELAILHGVLTDKAIRLLGALRVDDAIRLPDPAAP